MPQNIRAKHLKLCGMTAQTSSPVLLPRYFLSGFLKNILFRDHNNNRKIFLNIQTSQ
jgi:hypothetical protein